jgi:7-cyano-7-deazaguanine synthase
MHSRKHEALVLFSGGMDSTISLFYRLMLASQFGGQVHTLTFDYRQKHVAEVEAARSIIEFVKTTVYAPYLGQSIFSKLEFPEIGSLVGRLPIDRYSDIKDANERGDHDSAFVPNRNMVMIAMAGSHAYALDVNTIVTGLRGGFPDCTDMFEASMQMALRVAMPFKSFRIDTPTHMSRSECIRLAKTIPGCMEALGLSLTCFKGTSPPCGHCLPCLKRAEGFRAMGVQDPLIAQSTGQGA